MNRDNHILDGFSLMEVNIAVALVAVGLLAVFSLFPMGLRESNLSVADNHEAMFANHVLSCMESNAMQIKDWNRWSDPAMFKSLVVADVYPVDGVMSNTLMSSGTKFPLSDDSGKIIRYNLEILSLNGALPSFGQETYLLQLHVKSGRYGDFGAYKNTYLTAVTFMGE